MTPTATRLSTWRLDRESTNSDLQWIFNTLKGWNPVVIDDGTFVDSHTGKRIHHNHLRAMLRREYLSQKRPLTGKALERMLDAMIGAIVTTNKKQIELRKTQNHPQSMFDVHDDYL